MALPLAHAAIRLLYFLDNTPAKTHYNMVVKMWQSEAHTLHALPLHYVHHCSLTALCVP